MHKRSKRVLLVCCPGLGLLGAACSSTTNTTTTTSPASGSGTSTFPVTVHAANGVVHITARPRCHRVDVAHGDGDAVRHRGRQPGEGRRQVLRLPPPGTAHDPGRPSSRTWRPSCLPPRSRGGVRATAAAFPSTVDARCSRARRCPPATTLADAYAQYGQLGAVHGAQGTGRRRGHAHQDADRPDRARAPPSRTGQTYYYELDPTYFSVTSSTFIGKVLGLLGLKQHRRHRLLGGIERGIPATVVGVHRQVEPRLGLPRRHALLRPECAHASPLAPGGRR